MVNEGDVKTCTKAKGRTIKLLKRHHNQPERIKNSKFLALRFQTINGLCLSVGFAISSFFYN